MERLTIGAFVFAMFFSSAILDDPKKTMSFEESRHIADSVMRAVAGDSVFEKCFFLDSSGSFASYPLPYWNLDYTPHEHLKYSKGKLHDSLPYKFVWRYNIRSTAIPELLDEYAEVEHRPYGEIDVFYRKLPECVLLPSGCEYMDSNEAKAYALKRGMKRGLYGLTADFGFYNGRLLWGIETILSDSSKTHGLKYTYLSWVIDAQSKKIEKGKVQSIHRSRIRQ